MKAIILAAGLGERLKEISKIPKPLFKLGKKSLLDYSLEALIKNGIKEIDIVIGYKGDKIKDYIGNNFLKENINYIVDDLGGTYGSMHSFYCSIKKNLQGCLVLDGDIIYEPNIINELINHEKKEAVVLTNCCGSGDEVYVTLDKNNDLTYLGKEKPQALKLWEFTGISKFSENFLSKMIDLHEKDLNLKKSGEYYEDCAFRVSNLIPWYGLTKPNLPWSEIDNKEDIKRAEETLKKITLQ